MPRVRHELWYYYLWHSAILILMKALTISQPFASLVAYGEKTVEFRRANTAHRGPLLICAGATPVFDDELEFPSGVAVAVCMLAKVEPFTPAHLEAACMEEVPASGGFAWHLRNAKEIVPFAVRGMPGIFDSDAEQAILIDDEDPKDHIDYWVEHHRKSV